MPRLILQPLIENAFIHGLESNWSLLREDYLGEYVLTFDDDSVITYPVIFGLNISNLDRSWSIQISDEFDVYDFDRSLIEVSHTALPVREGSQTYYKIVFTKPFPWKRLVSFNFKPKDNLDAYVVTRKMMQRL